MSSECSDCARYIKEIGELKKAFIEANYQSIRQCEQLNAYEQIQNATAEIEQIKQAEHSSGSQNKKKMLEEVAQPDSSIIPSTSTSINW